MTTRPRAAFVMTVSIVGSVLGTGCGKSSTSSLGECKPPDCHANPPAPTTVPISANPPAVRSDAGAEAAPSSTPVAK